MIFLKVNKALLIPDEKRKNTIHPKKSQFLTISAGNIWVLKV